jgi:hypothetical protein
MNKKKIIIPAAIVIVALLGGLGYTLFNLQKQKDANAELQTLALLDKKEMENEYSQFALQYDELKRSIKNDSLMQQLTKEQQRTQDLLAELKKTKSDDAREITRLKKELATVRAVLRSYILQVDSLQRLNTALESENQQVKARYNEATTQISNLNTEKANLSQKVAIASQLDATGISLQAQNKRNKSAKKVKDVRRFVVNFTITKNITASTGNRNVYVRLLQPTNSVVNSSGNFEYENRSLQFSAMKVIEYTGEEQNVTLYIPVNETLSTGNYRCDIFADGQNIGTASVSIEK